MAVVDPNYENFNFQALLNNSVSPINRLGEGQLAIAQQNDQRNFQLMAQQRQAELEQQRQLAVLGVGQRNRLAEINASEQARVAGNSAEAKRQLKSAADNAVAVIRQTHPDYKDNPNDPDEVRLAKAQDVGHQDIYKNLTDAVDKGATLKGQLNGQIDEVGKAIPPDWNAIGQKVAIDPTFQQSGTRLDPAIVKGLSDGTLRDSKGKPMDVRDVIADLRAGRLSGTIQGWATGTNPNTLADTLAQKVQAANDAMQQANQQRILYRLNTTEKAMSDRLTANNELQSNIIKSLPASYQSKAFNYINQSGTPPNTAPTSLNGAGLLGTLAGSGAGGGGAPPTPTAAGTGTQTALTDQGNYAINPKMQNPIIKGLVANNVPDWANQDPSRVMDISAQRYQDTIDSANAGLKRLGATIGADGKVLINPISPDTFAMFAGSDPGMVPPYLTKHLSPNEVSKRQKEAQEIADHYQFAGKALATLSGQLPMYGGMAGGGSPTLPPTAPASQTNTALPSSPLPGLGGAGYQPSGQGAPAQAPLGQQGNGASVDPMQIRAGQNRIAQVLGTSDPAILQAAIQRAKQLGIDVQALGQGVGQGDPHAIATAKGIIADIQGNNNGQLGIAPNLGAGQASQPVSSFGQ